MSSLGLLRLCRRHNSILGKGFIAQCRRHESTMVNNLPFWYQSISNSSVVRHSMDCLVSLHDYLHMPWFAEIALVTFMARTCVAFPLTILQRRILYRYEALKPEIQIISANLRARIREEAYINSFTKSKAQTIYSKRLTQEINRLIERDNCHPFKATLVALFQIPFWIVLSNCLRNFAYRLPDASDPQIIKTFSQLQTEGTLWFSNLTIPDSTGILPLLTCMINLTIIQLHVNERKRNNMKNSIMVRVLTNGGRLFSIGLVPIGLVMPADMSFYWLVSSTFGLLQNILLLNPKVKQTLKLNMGHG